MRGKCQKLMWLSAIMLCTGCGEQIEIPEKTLVTTSFSAQVIVDENLEQEIRLEELVKKYMMSGYETKSIAEDLSPGAKETIRFGEVGVKFAHNDQLLLEEYQCDGVVGVEQVKVVGKRVGEQTIAYELKAHTEREVTPLQEIKKQFPGFYPRNMKVNEKDRVKLEETYWVTVESTTWKIESIEEGEVIRKAYGEGILEDQTRVTIEEGLKDLFKHKEVFFETYEKMLGKDEKLAKAHLRDGISQSERFCLDQKPLARHYPAKLNPYKLGEDLVMDWEQMVITPSVYSSQKQSRFQVVIPVTLLRNHYNKVYYKYHYFIGIEEGKIEWIQPTSIETIVP